MFSEVTDEEIKVDIMNKLVNYPTLTDGASCLIESSCPVIISFAEISQSRGASSNLPPLWWS
jgi:hypothetical protein